LNELLFWGINFSKKGKNLRHRAACKKKKIRQFEEYSAIPEDEIESAIWQFGGVTWQ